MLICAKRLERHPACSKGSANVGTHPQGKKRLLVNWGWQRPCLGVEWHSRWALRDGEELIQKWGRWGDTCRRWGGRETVALAGAGRGQRQLTWAEGCRGDVCACGIQALCTCPAPKGTGHVVVLSLA